MAKMKTIKTRVIFQVDFYVNEETSEDELLMMATDFVSHELDSGNWALEKGEEFKINIIDKFVIK